eukprot:4420737-Prymnesium_polylepis.1
MLSGGRSPDADLTITYDAEPIRDAGAEPTRADAFHAGLASTPPGDQCLRVLASSAFAAASLALKTRMEGEPVCALRVPGQRAA